PWLLLQVPRAFVRNGEDPTTGMPRAGNRPAASRRRGGPYFEEEVLIARESGRGTTGRAGGIRPGPVPEMEPATPREAARLTRSIILARIPRTPMTSTGPSVARHVKETAPVAGSKRKRVRLGELATTLW